MKRPLTKSLLLALISVSISLESCICYYVDCIDDIDSFNYEYLAPIYEDSEVAHKISVSPTKDIENPANIFTYLDYLIVNIKEEGFHVIDNTNPSAPVNEYFVNIPGNTNVAIKDGMLFADNFDDIIAFTIEDGEVSIKQRLQGAIASVPPKDWGVQFECVDESKGTVVGWEFVYVETEEELPACLTQ